MPLCQEFKSIRRHLEVILLVIDLNEESICPFFEAHNLYRRQPQNAGNVDQLTAQLDWLKRKTRVSTVCTAYVPEASQKKCKCCSKSIAVEN